MTVDPGAGSVRTKVALIRLVRIIVLAALAALGTWLVGPGPGDVFGAQVALFIVPTLTAILAAVDKYVRFTDDPAVAPVVPGTNDPVGHDL